MLQYQCNRSYRVMITSSIMYQFCHFAMNGKLTFANLNLPMNMCCYCCYMCFIKNVKAIIMLFVIQSWPGFGLDSMHGLASLIFFPFSICPYLECHLETDYTHYILLGTISSSSRVVPSVYFFNLHRHAMTYRYIA